MTAATNNKSLAFSQSLKIVTNVQSQSLDKLASGEEEKVSGLSIVDLLPRTDQFVTYSGSLTSPPCQESVTWVVPNKPVYMTLQQLNHLTRLMQVRMVKLINYIN